MTELIASAIALIMFAVVLPMSIRRSRRSRPNSGVAGVGDALSGIFDPARKAAVEQIEKYKDIGDAAIGEAGERQDS